MTNLNRNLCILGVMASLCLLLSPFAGNIFISPRNLLDAASPDYLIFWRLRLPRALGAFLAGSTLSLCGLVFQALFRNPLATPYTLGISSGAAFGASLYFRFGISLGVAGITGSLVSALFGSLLSMLIVYAITRARGGFSTAVMLLAGVITSFFFSSLVMFVQYLSNARDAAQITRWLMGSLSSIDPAHLIELLIASLGCLLAFRLIRAELDLLTAGEDIAASRGVNVSRVKLAIFLAGSAGVGITVSVTGPIGFVGMMIPQICRSWLGCSHRALIPASFFMGGGFLVLCDLLARLVMAPAELPIGILTAMLGAPFFLWTLFRGNRAGNMD